MNETGSITFNSAGICVYCGCEPSQYENNVTYEFPEGGKPQISVLAGPAYLTASEVKKAENKFREEQCIPISAREVKMLYSSCNSCTPKFTWALIAAGVCFVVSLAMGFYVFHNINDMNEKLNLLQLMSFFLPAMIGGSLLLANSIIKDNSGKLIKIDIVHSKIVISTPSHIKCKMGAV